MSTEGLPTRLKKLLSNTGSHRKGFKLLTFGFTGGGKSFFLAHMPRPLVVIEAGEGGIEQYLLPPLLDDDGNAQTNLKRVFAGEEDLCITVTNPDDLEAALDWVFKHENKIASVVLEPMNHIWEDHMDYWNDKLNRDISGGDWRLVKGPWKKNLKRLMRSPMNVGMGAWLKDTLYESVPQKALPGVEAKDKLVIRAQEVPQVEKSVPYTVDMVLQCSVVLDARNRPTSKHSVTLTKGRRPRSVDPKEFYVGRTWDFDAKKPVNPWNVVIAPLLDKWSDGAVDYLGADPEVARRELHEIDEAASDNELGRMLMVIDKPYKTMLEYKEVFDKEIAQTLNLLSPKHREKVREAHDKKKKELQG